MRSISFVLSICFILSLPATGNDLFDESLEDIMNMESELKADVGSRSGAKNVFASRSPIDVITSEQIEHSGLSSLTDILRYAVAGFNAPETSVADGSDHIRAFTLRGMSPDQVLVLVNGKRLHTSALLHVNGTIGRGSSSVDLDTITPIAIEKIEILRDGAAAQYGSDAIAGVINIILKGVGQDNKINIHSGKRLEGDGALLSAESFISVPLKYDGFINISMQAKQQERTNRAGVDKRLTPPAIDTFVGLPQSTNYLALLNAEAPQANNINFYTNAILNYRESEASAFFRPSNHNIATPLLYPNGFLPMINAKILDYSATVGVSGKTSSDIYWDISNVYGANSIEYNLDNTMNYSLGVSSPSSFHNGSLNFIQNTLNLDLKKSFKNFDLAGGLEYRYESYQIKAGDIPSYINGGSQGFLGYAPENATDVNRNSYAAYLDATYNINDDFAIEGAGRYEKFSDFGATTNLKLALSYNALENLLLRSSASTGFRAPSLAQSNYSHTSTFGGLIEGTFKPSADISQALGATDLKAEKSKHFTIGSVYEPIKDTFFMIDYFYTAVEDRIMLSNDFILTPAMQTQYGINKARFFTNAVDTQTQGVDIKINHKHSFENSSVINLSLWYNYSKNLVTAFNDSSTTRENSYEQIDRMENGQPKDSIKLLTHYSIADVDTTLNINRYGSYRQVINNIAYEFEPAWTIDLDLAYQVSKNVNVAVGGNNILDTMPNKWDGLDDNFYGYNGIKPYSRYSPFGYSGAYYYVRATIVF